MLSAFLLECSRFSNIAKPAWRSVIPCSSLLIYPVLTRTRKVLLISQRQCNAIVTPNLSLRLGYALLSARGSSSIVLPLIQVWKDIGLMNHTIYPATLPASPAPSPSVLRTPKNAGMRTCSSCTAPSIAPASCALTRLMKPSRGQSEAWTDEFFGGSADDGHG
jgi:hypothetical protein